MTEASHERWIVQGKEAGAGLKLNHTWAEAPGGKLTRRCGGIPRLAGDVIAVEDQAGMRRLFCQTCFPGRAEEKGEIVKPGEPKAAGGECPECGLEVAVLVSSQRGRVCPPCRRHVAGTSHLGQKVESPTAKPNFYSYRRAEASPWRVK